jgi:hypothetical protein
MARPQKPLPPFVGPLVLASDVAAAGAVWYFREPLLGPGQDMIAGAVAGFLIMGGLVAFMIFKKLGREVL